MVTEPCGGGKRLRGFHLAAGAAEGGKMFFTQPHASGFHPGKYMHFPKSFLFCNNKADTAAPADIFLGSKRNDLSHNPGKSDTRAF
jgi:hypothetical protein